MDQSWDGGKTDETEKKIKSIFACMAGPAVEYCIDHGARAAYDCGILYGLERRIKRYEFYRSSEL